MKKVLLFICIAVLSTGCASKKQVYKGDVEVIIPCSGKEYHSDKKAIRASGMGTSNIINVAQDKALVVARERIASQINILVKNVTDNYVSSYEVNNAEEGNAKFQARTLTIVKQLLSSCSPICEKVTKSPDGTFHAYVALEMTVEEIALSIDKRISQEDKLLINYEYEKFKQTFEEEMSKL